MSGTHWNDGCCFDYGNSETDDKNDGCATMEAIYFGNASWHGNRGAGTGPWLGGDFEQGMYFGGGNVTQVNPMNKPLTSDFVSLHLKGRVDGFALKGGDATKGTLATMYDGVRPDHKIAHTCVRSRETYQPMRKEGAIILATGGDQSASAEGCFYEGIMATGATSDATDAAIHANQVAVGYKLMGSGHGSKPRVVRAASQKATTHWKAFTCYPERNAATKRQTVFTEFTPAIFGAPSLGRLVGAACPIAGPGTGAECLWPAAEGAATSASVPAGGHALFTGWAGQSLYLEKKDTPAVKNRKLCTANTPGRCTYWLDGDAANATADQYPGIWFDEWINTLAARHDAWFRQLKEAGGEVDILLVDFESSPGPDDLPQFKVAMQKNGHGEKKVHEAILADSRWPALRQQFADVCGPFNVSIAETDMRRFTAWDPLGPQAQCWNEVMTRRSAAGINAAVFKPLWKYFPKARGSNFCHWHKHNSPRVGGWAWADWGHTTSSLLGNGSHVGTDSAAPFYGARLKPDPSHSPENVTSVAVSPAQVSFATPDWQLSVAAEPFTVLLEAVIRARNIVKQRHFPRFACCPSR